MNEIIVHSSLGVIAVSTFDKMLATHNTINTPKQRLKAEKIRTFSFMSRPRVLTILQQLRCLGNPSGPKIQIGSCSNQLNLDKIVRQSPLLDSSLHLQTDLASSQPHLYKTNWLFSPLQSFDLSLATLLLHYPLLTKTVEHRTLTLSKIYFDLGVQKSCASS